MSSNTVNWSKALEQEVVDLYLTLDVGASGAVSSAKGIGLSGIVKETADGQYSITLKEAWIKLLHASVLVIDDATSAVAMVQILENPANLQADMKADKTFKIQCLDFTGAAVNPTSGCQLKIKVTLRNSSYGPAD